MAVYSPTTWVNGGAPAINAANLQKIEDRLEDISQAAGARTNTIEANTVPGYGIGSMAVSSETNVKLNRWHSAQSHKQAGGIRWPT